MEKSQISHDISFVVRHYRKGVFDRRRAWLALPLIRNTSWWRRHTMAAAASVAVVIAAAATVYYVGIVKPERTITPAASQTEETVIAVSEPTARFEFDGVALSKAVEQIEESYGITLVGLPDGDPELTLTFEGTAADLVALINESLDSHISISR